MRRTTFWLSLLLIFVLPWENVIKVGGIGELSKAIGLVVALFWIVTVVVTGRFRALHPFHGAVFLLVLWKITSAFWSVNIGETVPSLSTNIQLLGLVVILWDLYTTPKAVQAGLQAYVLGAYVSISNIVVNQLSGTTFLYQRYTATGFHVDDIGVILALGIPVAWYLATSEPPSSKARHVLKLVNYAYIPAAFLGISLTGTRTALVAALPAVVYGLGSLARLKPAGRVVIFVALVCGLLALQSFVPQSSFERLSTTGASIAEGDLNGRVRIWRHAFEAFVERPLTGFGSGAVRSAIQGRRVAHNSFISILVEVGIVGLLLFGIVVVIAFRQAMRHPRWEARFWVTVLIVWVLGASALTWELRKQTWLFLGLVVVSANLPDRRGELRPRPMIRHSRLLQPDPPYPTYSTARIEGAVDSVG